MIVGTTENWNEYDLILSTIYKREILHLRRLKSCSRFRRKRCQERGSTHDLTFPSLPPANWAGFVVLARSVEQKKVRDPLTGELSTKTKKKSQTLSG